MLALRPPLRRTRLRGRCNLPLSGERRAVLVQARERAGPETNPINIQNLEAAKRILDASGGQLEIRVFPNSQLGDQNRSVAQTRLGAIELLQISSHILADVVPVTALETIPFAYPSYVDVVNAVNGPLGAYTRGPIEKVGLQRLPGAWYEGTQQIENAIRPINGPADLRGLKMQVPPAAIDVALFKARSARRPPCSRAIKPTWLCKRSWSMGSRWFSGHSENPQVLRAREVRCDHQPFAAELRDGRELEPPGRSCPTGCARSSSASSPPPPSPPPAGVVQGEMKARADAALAGD